jgi:hypothetical protein
VLDEGLANRLDGVGGVDGGFDYGAGKSGDCQGGRDDATGTLARVSVTICDVGPSAAP